VKLPFSRVILAFSALILTVSAVYISRQTVDWEQHEHSLGNLRNIQLKDSQINQEVLKIRFAAYSDYDKVSQIATDLRTHAKSLEQVSDSLAPMSRALSQNLMKKIQLLEQFKSANALLKNALISLPTLMENTKPHLRFLRGYQKISSRLDKLAHVTLLNSQLSGTLAADINTELDAIATWQVNKPKTTAPYINKVVRHIEFISEKQTEVGNIINNMLQLPIADITKSMQQIHLDRHEARLADTNASRILLYVLSLALLTYTVLVLFKLKRNSQELNEEKDRALVTLQSIGDGVITTDAFGNVRFLNPIAEELTGWTTAEAQQEKLNNIFKIQDEQTKTPIEGLVDQCISENRQVSSTESSILISRDGKTTPIEESVAPIRGSDEQLLGAIIVFRDVSRTRDLSRKLAFQASHDALTGVINRRAFDRKLKYAISSAKRNGRHHSLFYLDLDQFKIVNDTCGHDAGDHLLIKVTSLLQQKLRNVDTLARLGGDEFGILLENSNLDYALNFAKELLYEFKNFRFNWQGISFQLGTSIGIVQIHKGTESIVSLLSAADMACYVAKDMGRNRFHVFHNKDKELMRKHGEMQWVSRLTQAFKEGRFVLYRQAVVPLRNQLSNTQRHYELLIRLRDDTDELILPSSFIPAAERYNIMPILDRWVIRTAFEQCFQFSSNDRYAINLSGTSLNSGTLLEYITKELRRTPVIPDNVCFEITETAAIENLEKAAKLIKELKQLGFKFALDDFGKGLSSYSYLSNLPVDYLKIDGEFVSNLTDNPVNCEIIKSVNHIGHLLGMKTIAECVENEKTSNKLAAMGVDFAQGHKFGLPEPIFVNWALAESSSIINVN